MSFFPAYHSVTTSLEYVLVGTLFALAKPVKHAKQILWNVTKALGKRLGYVVANFSPKSASFRSPASLMSRFCGLRSLCRTLREWQ